MEDRNPQILRGKLAGLNDLRGGNAELSESVLFHDEVEGSWKENDKIIFESVSGKAFVTTERVLFVANVEEGHDVSVDSECILLHATTGKEPRSSIYLQLQEKSSSQEMAAPLEFTIVPNVDRSCQRFFEALTKLVSMHPTDDDDYIDGGEEEMMFIGAVAVENEETTGDSDERRAMLDRLDNLLDVPSHLQVEDGQFDDADELL